jgi:hypothetical protein
MGWPYGYIAALLILCGCQGQYVKQVTSPKLPKTLDPVKNMSLFSWMEKGIWQYSLEPNVDGDYTVGAIRSLSNRVGDVEQLKARLSSWPSGGEVIAWRSLQTPGFDCWYPPLTVVEEIRRVANKRKIMVEVLATRYEFYKKPEST